MKGQSALTFGIGRMLDSCVNIMLEKKVVLCESHEDYAKVMQHLFIFSNVSWSRKL